jgi:hypothetical protein
MQTKVYQGHRGGASEDSGGVGVLAGSVMDDGGVDWGWAGKSHRLWILAAARPCGGATVVVDPSGTAFVGVWGTAAVDAAAAARERQHSPGATARARRAQGQSEGRGIET